MQRSACQIAHENIYTKPVPVPVETTVKSIVQCALIAGIVFLCCTSEICLDLHSAFAAARASLTRAAASGAIVAALIGILMSATDPLRTLLSSCGSLE